MKPKISLATLGMSGNGEIVLGLFGEAMPPIMAQITPEAILNLHQSMTDLIEADIIKKPVSESYNPVECTYHSAPLEYHTSKDPIDNDPNSK